MGRREFKGPKEPVPVEEQIHECDNCGARYRWDELEDVSHLHERVTPGGVMPSGECPAPDCGALCYPVVEE